MMKKWKISVLIFVATNILLGANEISSEKSNVSEDILKYDAPLNKKLVPTTNKWKQTRIQVKDGDVLFIGYYSMNFWGANDEYFIFQSQQKGEKNRVFCKFYLKDKRIEKCYATNGSYAFSHTRNTLYVVKKSKIYKVDLNEKEPKEVLFYEYPVESIGLGGPFEISPDESKMAFGAYRRNANKNEKLTHSLCVVIDLNSGKKLHERLVEGVYHANHWIYLRDNRRVMYAHEGTTNTIADRINLIDPVSGNKKILHQHLINKETGQVLEHIGHEMRGGNTVCAVRYSCSELPGAIVAMDTDGSNYRIIDYDSYWHCSCNPNTGEIFVGDTMWWGKNSIRKTKNHGYIIRLDTKKGTKEVIKEVAVSTHGSRHPHPSTNGDGSKVLFSEPSDFDANRNSITLMELETTNE